MWEGCGQQVVNDRYYVLVRQHHPDSATAGVDSPLAKQLSNEIFIYIQKAYKALRKREREQTVAPPVAQHREAESDALSQARQAYEAMRAPQPQDTTSSISQPVTSGEPSSVPTQARSPGKALKEDSLSEVERRAKLSSLRSRRQVGRVGRSTLPLGSSALGDPSSTPHEPHPQPMGEDERRTRLDALRQRGATLPEGARDPNSTLMVTPKGSDLGALNARTGLPERGIDPEQTMDWEKPLEQMSANEAFNLGFRDFRKKSYASAHPAFARAHEAEPTNGKYLTFYAYTLFLEDQAAHVDEAIRLLKKAVRAGERQSLPDAHLFLGLVYKFKGGKDLKSAGPHLQRAMELNPLSNVAAREYKAWAEKYADEEEPQESAAAAFLKKLFKK
ncbi:MAG: hypothetical protein AAGI01_11810 [Myxococcota bacterium]